MESIFLSQRQVAKLKRTNQLRRRKKAVAFDPAREHNSLKAYLISRRNVLERSANQTVDLAAEVAAIDRYLAYLRSTEIK